MVALGQADLKRIIAFRTCRQVAFMVLRRGMLLAHSRVFLLVTHAFYKAMLFTGAGRVLHAIGGVQDVRLMGGMGKWLQYRMGCMMLARLALVAVPRFRGFYRKDVIIEMLLGRRVVLKHGVWLGRVV